MYQGNPVNLLNSYSHTRYFRLKLFLHTSAKVQSCPTGKSEQYSVNCKIGIQCALFITFCGWNDQDCFKIKINVFFLLLSLAADQMHIKRTQAEVPTVNSRQMGN